jgi:carboxypeptidase C (cathepsin A)
VIAPVPPLAPLTCQVPNQSFDFTFLTVNGAGHMVPQHKPVRALAMITRFFADKPF